MRGFWLGLVLGVAIGGAGVYVGLRRPWHHRESGRVVVAADAGADRGGADHRGRGRRHHRHGAGGAGDDTVTGGPVEVSPEELRLVWRGPAVSLPARDVDMGGGGGGGRALQQGEIDDGIRAHADAVLACIKKARGDAEIQSTITLQMLVDGQGRVEKSRVRAPVYLMRQGLEACVEAASRGFSFAATGAPTIVTVPFDLS